MMPVESVGGVVDGAANGPQRLGLSQEDFLKVLLAQLSFQDPLDPLDNKDFIAQLAQFTSLEQSRQVNEKLETLLLFEGAGQAVGLLGRTVEVITESGTVVGNVTSTAFQEGVPVLTIRTEADEFLTEVGLSQIRIIR
jgi:flagellar basal-body rod modification protein FlgD